MNVSTTLTNNNGLSINNQADLILHNDQMSVQSQSQSQLQQQQHQTLVNPAVQPHQQQQQQSSQLEITGVSRPTQSSASQVVNQVAAPIAVAPNTAKESIRFRIVKTDSDRKSESVDETIQVIPSGNTNLNSQSIQHNDLNLNLNNQSIPATQTTNAANNNTNSSNFNGNLNETNTNNANPSSNNLINNYQRGRWFVADFLPENLQQQNLTKASLNQSQPQPIAQQQQQLLGNDDSNYHHQISINSTVNSIDRTKKVANNSNNNLASLPPLSNGLVTQSQQHQPQQAQNNFNQQNNQYYDQPQIYQQQLSYQAQNVSTSSTSANLLNQSNHILAPQTASSITNLNPTIPSNLTSTNYINIPTQPKTQQTAQITNLSAPTVVATSSNDFLIQKQQQAMQAPLIPTSTQSVTQIVQTTTTTNTDNTQQSFKPANTTALNNSINTNIQSLNNNSVPQQSQANIDNLSVSTSSNSSSQIPSQISPKDQPLKQQQQSSANIDHAAQASNTTSSSIDLITKDFISDLGAESDPGIHSRIEQAMDIVKSHLTIAVKGEIVLLKNQINQLKEMCNRLEQENSTLKQHVPTETLRILESKGLINQSQPNVQTNTTQASVNANNINSNNNNNNINTLGLNCGEADSRISMSQDSMISSFTEHVLSNNDILTNINSATSSSNKDHLNLVDSLSSTFLIDNANVNKMVGSNME